MSIIHRTTLTPTKMELLSAWLPTRPWYLGTTGTADPVKAGGFRLDDPKGEVGIEFMVATDQAGRQPVTYHVPLTYRASPLDGADDALVGTTEHGVLGHRWVYDGTRDPVLVHQLVALIQGSAAAQAQSQSDTLDPTVQVRAASPAALAPAGFTAVDSPNGTLLRIQVSAAAELAVAVSRVLAEDAGLDQDGRGYVTAPWRRPDGTTLRSVFATATPGAV
jgi:hypothetical protein